MKKLALFVLLGAIVFSILYSGCITPTEYMLEMRDGVKLATDVFLPEGNSQPSGSILIRTPYNKDTISLIGNLWADLGWPTVIQDMRGRFASEGIDTVFRNAHTDGPDTSEWIADQSWSNGKIATFGGSALGICQYFMAGANPPNLACQYIQVATPNFYKHAIYPGGEFRKQMVEKWLEGQGSTYILPELWEHENYSLEYWTNVSLEDNWQDINVPAIHIGGWYDCFQQGILDGFMGYQYMGGSGALGKSKLIIGPWTHGGAKSTKQGQLTYPENCIDTFSEDLFWEMVEQYTMDNTGGYDEWPSVTYYTMGDVSSIDAPGNEWRYADDWPLPYSEARWYFDDDGLLSKDLPENYDPLTYDYDPLNPAPTTGGQNLKLPAGPFDQTPVESRDDVLVFTSDVLEEPYEATGPIKARLYVSSDCPDTDFTVKLSDVYPDGRSMLITDGILRMRNRNGFDHWELMEPGIVYEVEVDIWSTSYLWNTWHQIRVVISSSNYPRFLNNPNTADGIYKNTTYNIAHNTVYIGESHPSCIILPEVDIGNSTTPPSKPDKPDGPSSGKAGTEYTYKSSSIDPEAEQIYLLFDWDDGTHSGWVGPYDSDEDVSVAHKWQTKGTYNIRVKAKDITGSQSEWSDPLEISMPLNKIITKSTAIQFLQRLINHYPIFEKLLSNPKVMRNLGIDYVSNIY